MGIGFEDHTTICDLIRIHGHVVDSGDLERLGELFGEDVEYDVSDLGGGVMRGLPEVIAASLTLGAANPVAHHVTNIVLTSVSDDEVHALSKGLGILSDGGCGSVTYEDVVIRRAEGWRISRRKVLARRAPLGGRTQMPA